MIKKLELSNENINSCVSISEAKTHPFRVVNLNNKDKIKMALFLSIIVR